LHQGELDGEPPPQPEWSEHIVAEKYGVSPAEVRAWSQFDYAIAIMRIEVEALINKQNNADQRYQQAVAEALKNRGKTVH